MDAGFIADKRKKNGPAVRGDPVVKQIAYRLWNRIRARRKTGERTAHAILLTNDDGVHAPGLAVLETIANELSDDVFVVAPESDQSGVAHSLSLSDPLRLREISPRHYAVKGTPTDCVIMGVRMIMADCKPDLVLSGVNRGQNVAEDVTYSGTIAGAMEGAMLGIPSIALSQAYAGVHGRTSIEWNSAERTPRRSSARFSPPALRRAGSST